MLRFRLVTGPILILALVGIIALDNFLDTVELQGFWKQLFLNREHLPRGLALFVFCLLVVVPLGAFELSSIAQKQSISTRAWLTAISAMIGLGLAYCIPWGTSTQNTIAVFATGLVAMFVLSLLTFSQARNVHGVMASAGAVIFAMVYLGLMTGFLLSIRRNHSAWWIIGVVMTTKSSDIGAYFVGRAIGRHKMIPWLSPGKTWEGLFGGVAVAALTGGILAWASQMLHAPKDHVGIVLGMGCGAIFAVVGQFGDLTMSLLKRGAGLKDSSSLLPGMGGILDVLDSPLMVAPVAYWMLAAG